MDENRKKKVVIHGQYREAYAFAMRIDHIFDIVGFIDPKTQAGSKGVIAWDGKPLYSQPEVFLNLPHDFILVLDADFDAAKKALTLGAGLAEKKIIRMKNDHQPGKGGLFLCLANEIHAAGVPGAAVELGIDKGDTARQINFFFPDRTLYLFDTFGGFAESDVVYERTLNPIFGDGARHAYDNAATEEAVLNKMPHKDLCVIKKGMFPDSLNGLEDAFAFVHIDCDLTKPMAAAMEYFYPRLSPGGYICVHDYYNVLFPIVRQVVRKYASRFNATFVPVPSFGGAVLCKNAVRR